MLAPLGPKSCLRILLSSVPVTPLPPLKITAAALLGGSLGLFHFKPEQLEAQHH